MFLGSMVTSIDSHEVIVLTEMTLSFAFYVKLENPLKLYNYLKIKLIVHYLILTTYLVKCFLSFLDQFTPGWGLEWVICTIRF